jgi:hypothetical protein
VQSIVSSLVHGPTARFMRRMPDAEGQQQEGPRVIADGLQNHAVASITSAHGEVDLYASPEASAIAPLVSAGKQQASFKPVSLEVLPSVHCYGPRGERRCAHVVCPSRLVDDDVEDGGAPSGALAQPSLSVGRSANRRAASAGSRGVTPAAAYIWLAVRKGAELRPAEYLSLRTVVRGCVVPRLDLT